jgi:hypothetical protein
MIQDVIFLGAGASKAEGAPVQSGLFQKYFELCKPDVYSNPHEKTLYDRMRNFFNGFFGINVDVDNLAGSSFPTFEEALGVLELAIKREESFKGWSSKSPNSDIKIQRYRRSLISLITIVLERALRGEAKHHDELVKRLKQESLLAKTAFISVNYEILIDNALMKSEEVDYGVPIMPSSNRYSETLRQSNSQLVSLYKLHGSLNWLYCPSCIALEITPFVKSAAELEFRECGKCQSKLVPIIIPPTFFKAMANHFLEQIWYKTDTLLRTVKRIFFCGYSFPDADIHIKYLLKRAELHSQDGFEVYVINKPSAASSDERERYMRFFKNKEKIHYLKGSFEEFCKSGIRGMSE